MTGPLNTLRKTGAGLQVHHDNHYAAVDLGSNSFHMIVAREQGEDLQVLDRLREAVRLAGGMGPERKIQPDAMQRGLDCLARFGERLTHLGQDSVRVVGTNTLRRASNADEFMEAAEAALGYPIEIISGVEEARLIYTGVAPSVDPALQRRLVIDIGGGSTEVIIGELDQPQLMESLAMGCVTMTQRCFPDGRLDRQLWKQAVLAAEISLEPIIKTYRNRGWDLALGCSGTIREVQRVAEQNGWVSGPAITAEALVKFRKALLKSGHIDAIQIDGLSEDRRPVIAGGLAVLWALFECLRIEQLNISERALRDGLLYDLIGRMHERDVRSTTVSMLAARYEVDISQARRVESSALQLLEQVEKPWALDRRRAREYLRWAAYLHEVGLALTHSKHNRHGAYLIRHSDVAGFSQTEQRILSTLIYLQRGKFRQNELTEVPARSLPFTLKLASLLRLAVLLNRSRGDEALPPLTLKARKQKLRLELPRDWLDAHPLIEMDLRLEKEYLAAADFRFSHGAPRKSRTSAKSD